MVLQERYRNPSFAETDLEKWWTNVPKSLLTVGSKGVQESHLNSLVNLLGEHDHVRVKVASDQLDVLAIAHEFANNEAVSACGELLECRSKEFMFVSKDFVPKSSLRRGLERCISSFLEKSPEPRPELSELLMGELIALGDNEEMVRDEIRVIQKAFKKKGRNFVMPN